MFRKKYALLAFILSAGLLMSALSGCSRRGSGQEPSESVSNAETAAPTEAEAQTESAAVQPERRLSDEEALAAIRRYCYESNPDLEDIVNAGEYPVYWEIASSGEDQIVVLFRSYTGALVRYYIDPVTGETCVTEYAPGLSTEEERTGEQLNVWDYTDV